MPQFLPSVPKTATMSVPITPAGLSCTGEIYLTPDGVAKVATSGPRAFVSTGLVQDIQLPITMPSAAGVYLARIEILASGVQVGAYQAVDSVIIALPAFSYGLCTGEGHVCPTMTSFWYPDLVFTVINYGSASITRTLQLWKRSVSLSGGAPEGPQAITTPLGGIDNIRATPPGQPSPIQITLQPSGSCSYRYTGWLTQDYPTPGYQVYYTLLSRPRSYFFWLQDELGNMSPEVNIVRP